MQRRNDYQRSMLSNLLIMIMAIGFVGVFAACDEGEETYEEINPGSNETEQIDEQPVGQRIDETDQMAGDDDFAQLEEEGPSIYEQDRAQQQNQQDQMAQQDQQDQIAQQDQQQATQGEMPIPELNPSDISDQELSKFAAIYTQLSLLEQQGQQQQGAVGGGPPPKTLSNQEVEVVRNAGMETDRYLAIKFMLQDNEELQQRFEKMQQK